MVKTIMIQGTASSAGKPNPSIREGTIRYRSISAAKRPAVISIEVQRKLMTNMLMVFSRAETGSIA